MKYEDISQKSIYFFNKSFIIDEKTECWNYQKNLNELGYGRTSMQSNGMMKSHRFSYLLQNKQLPKNLHVLHKCDNPSCVNPNHLFLGTDFDNMQDKKNKGRHHNTLKTHCKHGHEFSKENTHIHNENRVCKICRLNRIRKFKLKPEKARRTTRVWCAKGHGVFGENVYVENRKIGFYRCCKECTKEKWKRKRLKEREKNNEMYNM